ncbi:MAG: DNA polymerase IV [Halanaerobiaceae bacterium]
MSEKKQKIDILHIDMDAFFAAVEKKDNPQLKNKPVIVGGTGLADRGVVSAASYEAREYGVHSAMPLRKARQLCPEGVFMPTRHKRYGEVSRQIFAIFQNYTPRVEKLSIDEAFLDLKGCHRLYGSSQEIGKKIKKEIRNELGLIASVGVSFNKFLAKLASDLEKPDGFVVITPENVNKVLEPLPVTEIFGVGEKTARVLRERGVETIKQLKDISQDDLTSNFGKYGTTLYNLARGIDHRKVEPVSETKSISHETTFKNSIRKKDEVLSVLLWLTEKVARRLRNKDLKAKTVFVKVRYDDFSTYTRRITLDNFIANTEKIYQEACDLLARENLLKKPIRLLGVGVESLSRKNLRQLSLFDQGEKNRERKKISETMDQIKERYGEESIQRARELIYKERNKDL